MSMEAGGAGFYYRLGGWTSMLAAALLVGAATAAKTGCTLRPGAPAKDAAACANHQSNFTCVGAGQQPGAANCVWTPPVYPRMVFHLPEDSGADDLNALFEYKGVAHLFRQAPHPWGWQHWTSSDWVRWTRKETALPPGAADGTLTLLPPPGGGEPEPIILYDCVVSVHGCSGPAGSHPTSASSARRRQLLGDSPVVGIARPDNASDPLLRSWTKDAANPIVIRNASGPVPYVGPGMMRQCRDCHVHPVSPSRGRWFNKRAESGEGASRLIGVGTSQARCGVVQTAPSRC